MNGTDIIITAVEGGINYWADVTEYRNEPGKGKVTLVDVEEGSTYTVTATQASDAAQEVVRLYPNTRGAGYILADNIDAEAADMIVQVACFGEVVYG